jgi:hypothetical protein
LLPVHVLVTATGKMSFPLLAPIPKSLNIYLHGVPTRLKLKVCLTFHLGEESSDHCFLDHKPLRERHVLSKLYQELLRKKMYRLV